MALIFLVLPIIGWVGPKFGDIVWPKVVPAFILPYLFFLTNFCFTLPGLFPVPPYMAIPWSVAIEEQFYLFWGFILSKCQNTKLLWSMVFCGLPVAALSRWLLLTQTNTYRSYYYNPLGHLDSLLFGVAVALLLARGQIRQEFIRQHGAKLFLIPILLYGCLALSAPLLQSGHISMSILLTLITAACASFLIAILFWQPAAKLFSHPYLIAVGKISYGMYLFHVLMITISAQLATQLFPQVPTQFELCLWLFYVGLAFVLTLITATASWHLLEKRFYLKRLKYAKIPSGFAAKD